MRRADRLFEIVQYMRGGRLLTAQALADKLEVSKRTIYRDLRDLQSCGVPIEGEAGVGYVLSSDYHVPPLTFTPNELAALMLGARMTKAWGGAELAQAAEEALIKIEAVIPSERRDQMANMQMYAIAFPFESQNREMLDRLRFAASSRHYLHLVYESLKGEKTKRCVRPLGLYFWGRTWTLLSWCELRGDFRSFRVDHISDIEIEEATFPREKGRELLDFVAREQRLYDAKRSQSGEVETTCSKN